MVTRVEIHFVSSLVWEGFGNHMMRWTFCSCWYGRVWSTHVEIQFVLSMAYKVFAQHILRCFLCPRCFGLSCVIACWFFILCVRWHGMAFDHHVHFAFCVFSTRVEIHFPRWNGRGLVKTCCYGLSVRAGTAGFEIHFVKSSAYVGLVNICRDAFSVLVNMGWDYSTHGEILFLSSLAWDTFDHNVLRSILYIRCYVEIHFCPR